MDPESIWDAPFYAEDSIDTVPLAPWELAVEDEALPIEN